MSAPLIGLASSSPRRQALLDQIGVTYRILPVCVDEGQLPNESPEAHVLRLARAKAQAGRRLTDSDQLPVLGADTVVALGAEAMGKPRDRQHGLDALARLSGRRHRVLSAVAVVGAKEETRLSVSAVTFRQITAAEREAYWETGEGIDKAGGYAIQGRAAAFIAHLAGSYSGVMGLPLYETSELLREFGIDVFRP